MAAKRIGTGGVVAAGLARATNGGVAYEKYNWKVGELDVLFDVAFQWMVPGAENVLWYGEYADALEGTYEYVYNNAERSSWLIDELEDKGYTIENTIDNAFTPITSGLLAGYNILVIPQLQVGDGSVGGDPNGLPSGVRALIKSFVEGGKGLFIMDAADHDGYNFYQVHNKVLEEMNFGMYFQPDTVMDPDSLDPTYPNAVFNAEVTNVLFGDNYQTATGKTTIQVYKVPSLAPEAEDYAVSVEILPEYREGLAGGTLKYKVKVTNVGKISDNYNLTVSDNIWPATISPPVLELENNFIPVYATLSVTIDPGASIGDEDNIAVTATSEDNTDVSSSSVCLAIAENRVRPSTADAQVVEAEPDDNYGERTFMYVGSSATGEYLNERMFVKFDLEALGTAFVENVRLYLYCFAINGVPDNTVRLHRVDYDWWEDNINWTNQPPIGSDLLPDVVVVDTDRWYSWDVTSYVQGQRENVEGDNQASFAISYREGSAIYPENWSYGFDTKEYRDNFAHPYLAVGCSVRTTVTSRYKEGLRDGTLSYTVMVQNTGALHDTYNLSVSDNASPSWTPTISPPSLRLAPGEVGWATLTVTIRPDAPIGENIDNLLVVATSTIDNSVSDNYWCVANVSTTNIRPPVDDSTAREAEPDGNWVWGTLDEIHVGRINGGPERGFLKFDLSAIPADTNIAKAKLHLNCYEVEDVGAVVGVHSVDDDSWIERGAGRLMWDYQPPIGSALDNRVIVKTGTYSWDVTSYVNNQHPDDNVVSFALVDLGENLPPDLHTAQFTSKESIVRENHPYLEILTADLTYDVRAYISPIFQGGRPGDNLIYNVTVKNKGTSGDTYNLTVDDNLNWGAEVTPTSLTIAGGASDTATLSVIVASGALCTLNRITVTATGTGVSDDAMCFAHLSGFDFKLENLYKIKLLRKVGIQELDISLRLREDADNLVAEFYGYNNAYDNESVVWENMPWHLTGKPEIPHPEGFEPVEKIWLVLVDETGAKITTVATFTVRRTHLMSRLAAIDMLWPYYPELRPDLMSEIADIDMQWPYAPF